MIVEIYYKPKVSVLVMPLASIEKSVKCITRSLRAKEKKLIINDNKFPSLWKKAVFYAVEKFGRKIDEHEFAFVGSNGKRMSYIHHVYEVGTELLEYVKVLESKVKVLVPNRRRREVFNLIDKVDSLQDLIDATSNMVDEIVRESLSRKVKKILR